jgi:5'-3' exoribonuclease 1
LKNEESILRSPVDYYPDNFEDDLYGSVRSFEAISLIPFLDQKIIQKAYNEGIKGVTEESQMRRNRFGKTMLYEYSSQQDRIDVKSPLSVIASFSCRIVKK